MIKKLNKLEHELKKVLTTITITAAINIHN